MSSKPSAPSVTTTSTQPTVPYDLQGAQWQFNKLLQGEYDPSKGGTAGFTGGLIPDKVPEYKRIDQFREPMNQGEWEALYTANKALDQPRTNEEIARKHFTETASGKYLDPNIGPLQQQIGSVKENVLEASRRNVGDIIGRTGAAGASGGSREALMLGQAAGDTSRALSTAIADLTGEQYGRERLIQQEAAARLPGFDTGDRDYQREIARLGLAGVPREQAQLERDAQVKQEQQINAERFMPIQIAQALMGQRMGQTIPIVQPGNSGLEGLAGLFGGGASMISALAKLNNPNPTTSSTTTTPSSGGGGGNAGWGGITRLFADLFGSSSSSSS